MFAGKIICNIITWGELIMKIKLLGLAAFVLLPTLLSGCVIAVDTDHFDEDGRRWSRAAESNMRHIHELSIGRSLQSVVDDMGQPEISEAFVRNGKTYRVYYYRTARVHSDGKTTKDETTPLVFLDDRLVGWGDTAVQHAMAKS